MSKLTSKFLTATALAIASFTGTSLAAQNELTIAIQLEPPHLDPTSAAAGAIDSVLYSNVFEGLTRFASDGAIISGLAKSWDISADGTEYTFHLHSGVTFHDGTAMDAEDVKFSLDRARGEDSTNAQKALFSGITDVSVVDSTTVKVNLDQANGSFLFNMAWGDAVIVAPESIEGIKNNPVGTGAFKFVNWVQGDRIELARNGDYWGAAPALDAATFKFISDPTAAFAAVMAQDVDVFAGFPAPENLPQFEADARFQVLSGSTEGETILSTNNKMPPLDNVKVRKAIAHAVDKNFIHKALMQGTANDSRTGIHPDSPFYDGDVANYDLDIDKANALLDEAGYPMNGASRFSLTIDFGWPGVKPQVEYVKAALKKVGIDVQVRASADFPTWAKRMGEMDFDLSWDTVFNWGDPVIGVHRTYVSDNIGKGVWSNTQGYSNARVDELLALAAVEKDGAKRKALYAEFQKIIADELPVYHTNTLPYHTVYNDKVGNPPLGIWGTSTPIDMTYLKD